MPFAEMWDTERTGMFEGNGIKNCFGHAIRHPNEDAERQQDYTTLEFRKKSSLSVFSSFLFPRR